MQKRILRVHALRLAYCDVPHSVCNDARSALFFESRIAIDASRFDSPNDSLDIHGSDSGDGPSMVPLPLPFRWPLRVFSLRWQSFALLTSIARDSIVA